MQTNVKIALPTHSQMQINCGYHNENNHLFDDKKNAWKHSSLPYKLRCIRKKLNIFIMYLKLFNPSILSKRKNV